MIRIDVPANRFTTGEPRASLAGKKSAKVSPWGRGPMACTKRARRTYDAIHAQPKGKTQ